MLLIPLQNNTNQHSTKLFMICYLDIKLAADVYFIEKNHRYA